MSNLKRNLITSLVLGILISSLVLIAPLTGNSRPTASVCFSQTTDCPDKFVTLVSPTTGDASTPQALDIEVSLDVEIRPLRGGGFHLKANGAGANLDEIVNPLPVKLAIGNDSGSSTVEAKIQRGI